MPTQQKQQQPAPDFIPAAAPDFIPADGPGEPAQDAAPETTLQKIGAGVKDFGIGVLKGAGSTANSIGKILIPDRLVSAFGGTPPTDEQQHNYFEPANTPQAVGKGVEQAGEFLLPGAGEEAATEKIAQFAPKLRPLARIATAALGSGAVNKAQGGTFAGGAGAGAGGEVLGMGLRKIAPKLAEKALGILPQDRAHGATPGVAALEHTSGFTPQSWLESAQRSMSDAGDEQRELLRNHPAFVDIDPARENINGYLAEAVGENHPPTTHAISKLGKQLDTMDETGEDIPRFVPVSRAATLNRGVANAPTTWNPNAVNDLMNSAAKTTHHVLGNSIAEVAPEVRPINQRMQSLMPVIQRARMRSLSEGTVGRALTRMGAQTGAMYSSVKAAEHFGPLAGLGTLVGTELLASPEARMAAARGMYSPAMRKLFIPAATGSALNYFGRPRAANAEE